MTELELKLEQYRREDINLFARKYSELFGQYFDKNTPEQKAEFEEEIKNDLNKKCSKYVLDDAFLAACSASGMAMPDKVLLSSYGYDDQEMRIHELVHQYNNFGKQLCGLKDFQHDLVLTPFDEGTTELIAQLIVGNVSLKHSVYMSELEIVNYLSHLLGEKTIILSTRGNPQLLLEATDKLLGTNSFLVKLCDVFRDHDKLMSDFYGSYGTHDLPASKSKKIMSGLKLEVIRGSSPVDLLYEAVLNTNNPDLLNKFNQTDRDYEYNYGMTRWVRETMLAKSEMGRNMSDVMQFMAHDELSELINNPTYEPRDELKKELLRFVFDKISFQKYFVGKDNYKYGTYKLTPEDIQYCDSFKSVLDGAPGRLGGSFGSFGPGNRVHELDNVIFSVNDYIAGRCIISGLGDHELENKRLDIISEQLMIAIQLDILDDFKIYIRNTFLKDEFPFFDDEILDGLISEVEDELNYRYEHVIDKYKKDYSIGNQSNDSIGDETLGNETEYTGQAR